MRSSKLQRLLIKRRRAPKTNSRSSHLLRKSGRRERISVYLLLRRHCLSPLLRKELPGLRMKKQVQTDGKKVVSRRMKDVIILCRILLLKGNSCRSMAAVENVWNLIRRLAAAAFAKCLGIKDEPSCQLTGAWLAAVLAVIQWTLDEKSDSRCGNRSREKK